MTWIIDQNWLDLFKNCVANGNHLVVNIDGYCNECGFKEKDMVELEKKHGHRIVKTREKING